MGLFDKVMKSTKGKIDLGAVDKVMDTLDDNLDGVLAKIPADKRDDIVKLLDSGKADDAIDKVCELTKLDKDAAEKIVEKLKGIMKA